MFIAIIITTSITTIIIIIIIIVIIIVIIIIIIIMLGSGRIGEPDLPVPRQVQPLLSTANLRTKILDVRGFDPSRILSLRGGVPRPMGNFL